MHEQPGRIEFTNHLMFNAVLTENEDLCKHLIGAVLGKHVEHIEYLDDEHAIQPDLDARGARLDVLALIDGEYVDVEMQVGREPDIARRCRFYHSAIATRYMPKGSGYRSVPTSYVIFICLADPFDAGLPRYELATACVSNLEVLVDDGATTILLNAQAWEQEENPEVSGMLQYALTGRSSGNLAKNLADAVDGKNLDRKWVRATMGVMTYEHEFRVLNSALEEKRAEIARVRTEIEQKHAELAQAQSKLEQSNSELAQAQSKLEQSNSELAQSRSELEHSMSELAQSQSKLEQSQSELSSVQAQLALSKQLYADGRIDEYFEALDNPELMKALLEEFAG